MRRGPIATEVPLAPKTTLGVGGPAAAVATVDEPASLAAALQAARTASLVPWVLGGGSNVVVHDAGVRAFAIAFASAPPAFESMADEAGRVRVEAPAGLGWDALVEAACRRGLWGLEGLSGIPGQVGAAPVQNIGAYGQSLADTLEEVTLVPLAGGPPVRVAAAALGLGYRDSALKRAPGRHAVTSVRLRLWRDRGPHPARLGGAEGAAAPGGPMAVREAVLAVRAAKGMLWRGAGRDLATVGSFFTNPTVPVPVAEALLGRAPGLPTYAAPAGRKLSAAWLIEASGLSRGHVFDACGGRVGLSPLHALAIVNRGGASATEVLRAARTVAARVRARFGVALVPEAQFVGFDALGPQGAGAWPRGESP